MVGEWSSRERCGAGSIGMWWMRRGQQLVIVDISLANKQVPACFLANVSVENMLACLLASRA